MFISDSWSTSVVPLDWTERSHSITVGIIGGGGGGGGKTGIIPPPPWQKIASVFKNNLRYARPADL